MYLYLRGYESHDTHNHRMQATAGGAALLSRRVGHSPAAPDAERYACWFAWDPLSA